MTFKIKRNCLFGKISSIDPLFLGLNTNEQLLTLLCPVQPKIAKLFNKYISIIFAGRTRLDNGEPLDRGNIANQNNIESESDDSLINLINLISKTLQ